MKNLSYVLNPQSVAVVGASTDPTKLNGLALEYLLRHDFQGKIYPVNPKYKELRGLRCYPSIADLPDNVDVAEILVGQARVIDILKQCAQKRVKSAIVFSSGFGEIGNKGVDAQNEMSAIAKMSGMIIHGPNCNGIVNFLRRIPLSFTPILECENLRSGNIGLISQSGGLGSHLLLKIYKNDGSNIGCSYYIGTGNEAVYTFEDYLDFLVHDDHTEVIACIVETFRNGETFLRIAEEAFNKQKPIVLLKLAVSELGKKAAMSHTAAVAGPQAVAKSILSQKGVVSVDSIEELMNACLLLSRFRKLKAFRVGVVTDSGGTASLVADLCERFKISLPSLKASLLKEISKMMSFGSPRNPLDLTGQSVSDSDYFASALSLFYQNPDFDAVAVVISGDTPEDVNNQVDKIASYARNYQKPTIVSYEVSPNRDAKQKPNEKLRVYEIPSFREIDSCFRAISCVSLYAGFHSTRPPFDKEMPARTDDERDKALQEITELSGQLITEPQGTKLLEAFGLPLVRSKFVTSLGQALRAAKNIGYPVALKAISARIPHKTEAGAIRLNVRNESELQAAYDQVVSAAQRYEPPATIEGVLIQQMIESGTEFVMGFSHTEQFGPVIAFGLGGIYVEVLRDVAFRAAPLRRCDAQEMIAELKCKDILKGTRGKAQLDIDSILTCLLNLSDLAISSSEHLSELDLNPVFVFPKGQGLLAVDYLIKRHAVKK